MKTLFEIIAGTLWYIGTLIFKPRNFPKEKHTPPTDTQFAIMFIAVFVGYVYVFFIR